MVVKVASAAYDYGLNVYDAGKDVITLINPAASPINKTVAAFSLSINAASEIAEPDEWTPLNVPVDDAIRHKLVKEFKEKLEAKAKTKAKAKASKKRNTEFIEPKIDNITKSEDKVKNAIKKGDADEIDKVMFNEKTIRKRQKIRKQQERRFKQGESFSGKKKPKQKRRKKTND